jgi:hypothetical protein
MAARRALLPVFLTLCALSGALAFEKEDKPNNYPNFEFHESAAEVKPQGNFEFAERTPEVEQHNRGYKPNNYPDFKFSEDNNNNQQYSFDASERFPSAQEDVVFNAHQGTQVFYKTGDSEYQGSDASNRYPSSYDLINAQREHENQNKAVYDNEVRFTNQKHAPVQSSGGSNRFYTPASDPDFAFRFAKPETVNTKENAYSQFNFDNSDATSDPTATYGSTSPVLAANNPKQTAPVVTTGRGCANMYWAEHTKQWPSFFTINTQVAQAFGTKAGDVYGTTTLLQALYDNREDGYSQLLSHGTAALMNAYAMPNYAMRHDAVIDQFVGALASRTAAGAQAQKFLNANHAYGPNECLN